MLALSSSFVSGYAGPMPAAQARTEVKMINQDGLKALAKAQNPVLGFYDPLSERQARGEGRT